MGNQVESLKKYLRRLGAGEDLEKVRKDFAVEFQDVDATVIIKPSSRGIPFTLPPIPTTT